jgi:hypothetical protein
MTPEPFYKSSAFLQGFFVSLGVNAFGLMFACSVMAPGLVGAGMSSQLPDELRETWYSFVWLAGLALVGIPLCLLAVFSVLIGGF